MSIAQATCVDKRRMAVTAGRQEAANVLKWARTAWPLMRPAS